MTLSTMLLKGLLSSLAIVVLSVPIAAQVTASAPTASPSASPASSPAPASSPEAGQPANQPSTGKSVSGILLPPEKANPVHVSRFEKPPVIDGKLDEDVWKTAAVLKDFYQIDPGDNTPPLKPTEVLLGYDAKFLYIAFRAFDESDKVRATVA